MKDIKFKDRDYQVPESWDEVTLQMVIDAQELSDLLPEAPLIGIMSAYTGIPIFELQKSDVPSVNQILGIMEFLNTEYNPTARNEFTFAGVHYSSMPDLAEQRFEDFLSIQTILYNNRENPVQGLSKMLSVYCKKDQENLQDINLEERQKLFRGLPFTVVKDIECFFLANLNAWKQIIRLSSEEQVIEKLILERFIELSNTMKARGQELGWYSPTRLLIGISRLYLNYLRKDLERSFNMLPTKL